MTVIFLPRPSHTNSFRHITVAILNRTEPARELGLLWSQTKP